ncbi:hypothetical protein F5B20DRAFT_306491 [Whalleya microplaca]|nr:hypothetical protein F5B20DRAFT_306491 [Whalleya microplaca]
MEAVKRFRSASDVGMSRPTTARSDGSSKKRTVDEISGGNEDRSISKYGSNEDGNFIPKRSMSVQKGDAQSSGRTTAQASSFDGTTVVGTMNENSDMPGDMWTTVNLEPPPTSFPRPASPTPSMSPGFPLEDDEWPVHGATTGRHEADSALSYTSQRPRHGTNGGSGHVRSNATFFGGRSGGGSHDSSLLQRLGNFQFQFQFPSGSNLIRNMRGSHSSSVVNRNGAAVHSTQREESAADIGSVGSRTSNVLADSRSASRIGNRTGLEVNMPAAISPIREEEVGVEGGIGFSTSTQNRFESPESPAVITAQTSRTTLYSRGSLKRVFTELFRKRSVRIIVIKAKTLIFISASASALALVSVVAAGVSFGADKRLHGQAGTATQIWLGVSITGFVLLMVFVNLLVDRRQVKLMRRRFRSHRDEEWIEISSQSNQVTVPEAAHVAGSRSRVSHSPGSRTQANIPPIDDELAHRAVLTRTDRTAQDAAWNHFSADGVRMRRYVEFLENDFKKNHPNHPAFSSPVRELQEQEQTPTVNAEPLVSPSQLEQDTSIRASTIGIARSTSLYESEKRSRDNAVTAANNAAYPSTPSNNVVPTSASQASIAAHEELSPIPLLQRDISDTNTVYRHPVRNASVSSVSSVSSGNSATSSLTAGAPTANTNNTSKPSLYPCASIDSLPRMPLVTQAAAMPSSSYSQNLEQLTTSNTIDDIVGRYGVSFESPKGYSPLCRESVLRSHAMTTEAGTPNSQKGSRISSVSSASTASASPSFLPVPVRGWSYHDEVTGMRGGGTEMSPIAEVSSSPLASRSQ